MICVLGVIEVVSTKNPPSSLIDWTTAVVLIQLMVSWSGNVEAHIEPTGCVVPMRGNLLCI